MKDYIKSAASYIAEVMTYAYSVDIAWIILVHYHLVDRADDMEWYWLVLVLFVTYIGGGYVIYRFEKFLWKRKVMKLARRLAEYQGLDPKTLDFKNITVEYDEESGIMEVIIEEKKEGDK